MGTWELPRGIEIAWTLVSSLVVVAALLAGAHVVLNKRDTRSAVGWLGLIVLVPLVGTVLYLLLGINRIRRRAAALRPGGEPALSKPAPPVPDVALPTQLAPLVELVGRVTAEPLLQGHSVTPLDDGDHAYPRMLEAIASAKRSVWMSTYIFETSGPGHAFVEALAKAQRRGVQVRVLIDAMGLRYARPSAHAVLKAHGVPVAAFLPVMRLGYSRFYNLRNHRKILVVDGERAFTGGMNIRRGHVLAESPPHPTRDLHFEIWGPVAAWLGGVFADDWSFSTGERLERPDPSACTASGPVLARGVVDGPDADLGKFRMTLMGGLACAQHSVRIVTPYFLPDAALASALDLAALRGVTVDVVLPERGNLPLVRWAMRAYLGYQQGSRVRYWLSPEPFDHSKVMVVDDVWSFFGSANWDPRSLRLNFEVGVECYDEVLARALAARVDVRMANARRLQLEELAGRSLAVKLRDGLAYLFTPYL